MKIVITLEDQPDGSLVLEAHAPNGATDSELAASPAFQRADEIRQFLDSSRPADEAFNSPRHLSAVGLISKR